MKNLNRIGLMVALMTLAVSTQAAVTLLTPEEIPVLALDQQEVSGSLFRSSKTTYKLDPGSREIAVRYEQLFNQNNGDHDVLKSAIVSLKAELQDNKTYRLTLVNPPKDYDAAKQYVKQPIIAIVDEQGNTVAQQQALDNAPKPLLGSSFFNRVLDLRNNDGQKDLTRAASTSTLSTTPVTSASTTAVSTVKGSTVEQLKQLWQSANEQERQQFMQSIIR
ncbi:MAG: DUF2057 domain-containing protein [Moraxellaceae bacterium]|nr:MAG: DUF2057 domain-containing protein [Moraxellaceae bacterium]